LNTIIKIKPVTIAQLQNDFIQGMSLETMIDTWSIMPGETFVRQPAREGKEAWLA
jgi:hypothetical protein